MRDLSRRSALSLALAAAAAGATGSAAEAEAAPIDPDAIEALRIYPPLGIARLGNATEADAYVIAPEVMGGLPTRPDGQPARLVHDFRNRDGRIKRQAARFRVYAHRKDGTVVEVTAAHARIRWRVAVANLKAGWYDFNQAMDLPRGLSRPAKRRNARPLTPPVSGGRAALDIVPTPRMIEGRNAAPVAFDDGRFGGKPVYLGELRTDAHGRLLVLGGRGVSAPHVAGARPTTFANNDGWHDDIADGPVRATVTFADGTTREAEAGYVAVTPPNFAPGLSGLVSMDDAVRETFQRQGWLTPPRSTSFTTDIWPIFDRLTGLQWINHGLFVVHGHGSPLDARDPKTIDRLRDNSAGQREWCRRVVALFRDPDDGELDEAKAPQVFGDAYGEGAADDGLAQLAVTATQYAHLRRWESGDFTDDWPGAPPVTPDFATLTPAQQVAHLERAPLGECLGGPFHPGIELTWVMRLPRLWTRAYRLNVLDGDAPARQDFGDELTPEVCTGAGGPYDGVAAGALTRFLGVPWQTDEASCNSAADYAPSSFLSMPTYWGARVPDQVFAAASFERVAALDPRTGLVQAHKHFMLRVDWLRDVRDVDYEHRIANMIEKWWWLGMVLPPAIVPAHLPADTRVEQGRVQEGSQDLKRDLVQAVEALAAPTTLARTQMFKPPGSQPPAGPPLRRFRQGEI